VSEEAECVGAGLVKREDDRSVPFRDFREREQDFVGLVKERKRSG